MKKLIIVESPSKIKTITKFLGAAYKIMSTMGHIKDLPQKKLGISMDNGITLDYVPLENKEKVIADIQNAAKKATDIYLAPDPDREGEMIAWHIAQEIKKAKASGIIHRISFNEITKPAIEDALKHPSTIDEPKVHAQQARRVLDRWVGYQVSPILWRKVARGLSAGRVQSVALRLVCEREREIQAFVPEEYWTIDGIFQHDTNDFKARLSHISGKKAVIKNEKRATEIKKSLPSIDFTISKIKDSERTKNPTPPFMTSTLQQAAYNQLGFSVQRTMQLAQKLYEGVPLEDAQTPVALITYMRTDSLRLSETSIKQMRSYIKKQFDADYLPSKSRVYSKATKGQDAHEAIRPVDVNRTPESIAPYIDDSLLKLYRLIWNRSVACQMASAKYAQRQVTIIGAPYTFTATGSTLLFDGFSKLYNIEEDEKEKTETVKIPATLKEKEQVALSKIEDKQHFTQPPARYTEASLVKKMEKEGIGRPSTYQTILKRIQERAYTELDKRKRFVPTDLGFTVTDLLVQYFPKIMDVKFTAHMEEDLDKIAQNELDRDKLLKEFYEDFSQKVKAFGGIESQRKAERTDLLCPKCKEGNLLIRAGRSGEFLGCERFPDCRYTSNFERDAEGNIKILPKKTPEELAEERKKNETTIACPRCEKNHLMIRHGRNGAFLGCKGYPKCRYTAQFERSEDGEIKLIEKQKPEKKVKAKTSKK